MKENAEHESRGIFPPDRPLGRVSGFLAFFFVRMCIAAASSGVLLAGVVMIAVYVNSAFTGTDPAAEASIMRVMVFACGVCAAAHAAHIGALALFILRKKRFICADIAADVCHIALYIGFADYTNALLVFACECAFFVYLLCSKRAALAFDFHTPFNRAALLSHRAACRLPARQAEALGGIAAAYGGYLRQRITKEDFEAHKRRLIDGM